MRLFQFLYAEDVCRWRITARFLTCADSSGWQIIPTRIIILIEICHQITEYVCKNSHLYNVCFSQYNGAKITTNTWFSDALELDIDVSCSCTSEHSIESNESVFFHFWTRKMCADDGWRVRTHVNTALN